MMFTNIQCMILLGKLIMVVGGDTGLPYINGSYRGWTDDIDILSPDTTITTVPDFLSSKNAFSPGTIYKAAGFATTPGRLLNC